MSIPGRDSNGKRHDESSRITEFVTEVVLQLCPQLVGALSEYVSPGTVNWRLLGASLIYEGLALGTISIVSITTHSTPTLVILLPFLWLPMLPFFVKSSRKPTDALQIGCKGIDRSETACSACGSSIINKPAPAADNSTDGS
jgi:hypothetical protein